MPSISRYRHQLLFTMLAIPVAAGSFLFVQKLLMAQGREAFTVTLRESGYDRLGKPVLVQTVLYAVRNDGSAVRARTLDKPGNQGVAAQRWIFDLSRGEEVSIDGITESTTTVPLTTKAVEAFRRLATCTSGAAREAMLGYNVVRDVINIGQQNAGRIIRKEQWRAPALDCFPLKEVLMIGHSEADLHIAKVNEAIQVVLGEPATSLFERPVGYVERSPSQRRAEFSKRYPAEQPCPSCVKEGDVEADTMYYRRQSDRGK